MNKCSVIFVIVYSLLIVSCVKDKPNMSDAIYSPHKGWNAYIVNEGMLGGGDATLSNYNIDANILHNNIYASVNNADIGDVLQSVILHDDQLILSVNNSNQLIFVDKFNGKAIGSLRVTYPRYILPIYHNKMYVGNLYNNTLTVIDPILRDVIKTIHLPYHSVEKMVRDDKGLIYASNWDTASNKILVIDPIHDVITDSITFSGRASHNLLIDKNNYMWVFYGNIQKNKPYGISIIDLNTQKEILHFDFSSGDKMIELIKPVMNNSKDTIYWLNVDYSIGSDVNGVYKMGVNEKILPNKPFIPSQKFQYFYALGYDTIHNHIWVGDPKSFSERSDVLIYNNTGELLNSFSTALGVGDFYFYYID